MKISSFFKILNRKINMYDKMATNPFTEKKNIIIVWVEESKDTNDLLKKENEKD